MIPTHVRCAAPRFRSRIFSCQSVDLTRSTHVYTTTGTAARDYGDATTTKHHWATGKNATSRQSVRPSQHTFRSSRNKIRTPPPGRWEAERRLLSFRKELADSNVHAVVAEYPKLLVHGLLSPQDSLAIIHLLHHAFRTRPSLMNATEIQQHVTNYVALYTAKNLPPHPRATLHAISYFKESDQLQAGINLWNWAVQQEDVYTNLLTYGAAIELLAQHGVSLQLCEETYLHGLKRYGSGFNEYHLSPGAILPSRGTPVTIPKTSMALQQGIIRARLMNDDWLNAYLGLDTALRLHPTELSSQFMHMFLRERPIAESFQVFCMLCRSGNRIQASSITTLLNALLDALLRKSERTDEPALDLALASLSALHHAAATNQPLDTVHASMILNSSMSLLPIRTDDLSEDQHRQAHDMSIRLLNQLFAVFKTLRIGIEQNVYNTFISLSGRLRDKALLKIALELCRTTNTYEDSEVTIKTTISAACQVQDADLLSSWWQTWTLSPTFDKKVAISDLARMVQRARRFEFFRTEIISKKAVRFVEDMEGDPLFAEPSDAESSESSESGLPAQIPKSDQDTFAASLSQASQLSDVLSNLQALVRENKLQNLKEFPPERSSIVRSSLRPAATWQRSLYEEMTVDSTSRVSNATKSRATKAGVQPQSLQAVKDVAQGSVYETATGFSLDELRFSNWSTINDLLLIARDREKDQVCPDNEQSWREEILRLRKAARS